MRSLDPAAARMVAGCGMRRPRGAIAVCAAPVGRDRCRATRDRASQSSEEEVRVSRYWVAAAMLAVSAVCAGLVFVQTFTMAMDRSRANASGTLRLATASLAGQLERYAALPGLIADRPELIEILRRPFDDDARDVANRYLADLARTLSVSDAYVMLPDGETVAASNFDAISFVGQNFRYRPYFQSAAEGRQGRFFGLGTTSDKRGFYFSDPIRFDGRIGGILTFKIDLDPIEATWSSNDTEILVVDPENIVFMAGTPGWRYHVFGEPDENALARSRSIQRYADEDVTPLQLTTSRTFDGRATTLVGLGQQAREFQVLRREMPEAGWTVIVLADTEPARRQALAVGFAVFLLLALALFLGTAERARRRRAAGRLASQAAAQRRLEQTVEQRTGALALANRRLEGEIAERRATEERLRRTQGHLVQAGKLAALGQMSAALSHEFNQPLAAASAYADNAIVLLDRGSTQTARETLGRIAALLDRLSTISRTLRNFARRPDDELGPVDIRGTVDQAMEIVGHRLAAVGARVEIDEALSGLEVQAVAIRLQQVLVNLLSNAADAVEGRPERWIALSARAPGDGRISILVEDSGEGVSQAVAPRIFDPFFTSKAIGKGLGLGLSISYNIVSDFGGRLSLERGANGGARFVVELAQAHAFRSAAQ